MVEDAALTVGLTVVFYLPAIGYSLIGLSLGVLAMDTARHDVACGIVRMSGLPHLATVCMLGGYVWALVPVLIWAIASPAFDGHGYDAGTHTITVGFVASMLPTRAPVIIPTVARREVLYHNVMWALFAFLQVFPLLRLLAGVRETAYSWCLGGILGVVDILPFVAMTSTVMIHRARINAREAR